MSTISWREENRGKHGLLISFEDPQMPKYESFFPSRLRLYLDVLDYLPLPHDWLTSLPVLTMENAAPAPGHECPICYTPYLTISSQEKPGGSQGLQEIPVRLPCGHILGLICIHRLAWNANASTCVVCPFCRASHNHVPISPEGTRDKLAKCMWVTLEIFLRRHAGWIDFEDMEAVLEWAHDDRLLREDVPEEEKREAIKFAIECWAKIGDEELLRLFAARLYGNSVQCTLP